MSQLGKKVLSHGLAMIVGVSSTLVALKYKEQQGGQSQFPDKVHGGGAVSIPGLRKQQEEAGVHSTLPVIKSPITIYRPNPNLEIAYDARSKNPVYVMEHIRLDPKKFFQPTADRTSKKFYEAKDLHSHHRSRNGYFHKSGFDRGHMAAAANYTSDDEMNDTFSLMNVSPQYPIMNRVIWSRLEELTRKFVREKSNTHDVIVITGPLWLPHGIVKDDVGNRRDWYQYSFYGFGSPPSVVQVPTHFFKVIMMFPKFNNSRREHDVDEVDSFAAFVIPNDNFSGMKSLNLQNCLVRITDLEATTGISFFPFETEEKLQLFDLVTEDIWMRNNIHDATGAGLGDSLVVDTSNPHFSKNRKAKIRKKLQEIEKNEKGKKLPLHLCADGSCSEVIRIKQKYISS
jgi:DNA/RNA endonuclease G (NUC1)